MLDTLVKPGILSGIVSVFHYLTTSKYNLYSCLHYFADFRGDPHEDEGDGRGSY